MAFGKKVVYGSLLAALGYFGFKAYKLYRFANELDITTDYPQNFEITGGVYGNVKFVLPVMLKNNQSLSVLIEDLKILGYEKESLIFTATYPYAFKVATNTVVPVQVSIPIKSIVNNLSVETINSFVANGRLNKKVRLLISAKLNNAQLSNFEREVTI